MIKHRGDFALLEYPQDWDKPLYALGQAVILEGRPCTVVGLQWLELGSTEQVMFDLTAGWWVYVRFPKSDPRERVEPVCQVHESDIHPYQPSSTVEYTRLVAV